MPRVIVQRALFADLDSCYPSSEAHVVDPSSPIAVRALFLARRGHLRPPLFHLRRNLVGQNVPALGPPVLQRPAPRPRPDPAQEAMSALAHQPARPRHRGPGAAADLGGAKDGAGGDGRLGDNVCDGGLGRRGRQGDARRRGAEDGARGPGEGRAQRREGCECPVVKGQLGIAEGGGGVSYLLPARHWLCDAALAARARAVMGVVKDRIVSVRSRRPWIRIVERRDQQFRGIPASQVLPMRRLLCWRRLFEFRHAQFGAWRELRSPKFQWDTRSGRFRWHLPA